MIWPQSSFPDSSPSTAHSAPFSSLTGSSEDSPGKPRLSLCRWRFPPPGTLLSDARGGSPPFLQGPIEFCLLREASLTSSRWPSSHSPCSGQPGPLLGPWSALLIKPCLHGLRSTGPGRRAGTPFFTSNPRDSKEAFDGPQCGSSASPPQEVGLPASRGRSCAEGAAGAARALRGIQLALALSLSVLPCPPHPVPQRESRGSSVTVALPTAWPWPWPSALLSCSAVSSPPTVSANPPPPLCRESGPRRSPREGVLRGVPAWGRVLRHTPAFTRLQAT